MMETRGQMKSTVPSGEVVEDKVEGLLFSAIRDQIWPVICKSW